MNIININKKVKKMSQKENKGDKEVIEKLEGLLKHAKSGRLVGFACVTLADDDSMDSIYSGDLENHYLSYQGMLTDLSMELKSWYEDSHGA